MNPFVPQTATTPIHTQAQPQHPPAAAAPPSPTAAGAPVPSGLDDPKLYEGFGVPLFPRGVAGTFDLEITGFAKGNGHKSGPAVHISFTVVTSNNPQVPVGSVGRIFYKYDVDRELMTGTGVVPGDVGPVHAKLLGQAIRAMYGAAASAPGFTLNFRNGAGAQLLANDWSVNRGRVQLQATLKPWTKAGTTTTENVRQEFWLPAPAAA